MAAHPLREGRGLNLKTVDHYLGAEYLADRNFDGAAILYHDAAISCMSGRTNALRTSVLQDRVFLDALVSERDLSRPDGLFLLAGEDRFITRWLSDHGIGMWVQYHTMLTSRRHCRWTEASRSNALAGLLLLGEATTSCCFRSDYQEPWLFVSVKLILCKRWLQVFSVRVSIIAQ